MNHSRYITLSVIVAFLLGVAFASQSFASQIGGLRSVCADEYLDLIDKEIGVVRAEKYRLFIQQFSEEKRFTSVDFDRLSFDEKVALIRAARNKNDRIPYIDPKGNQGSWTIGQIFNHFTLPGNATTKLSFLEHMVLGPLWKPHAHKDAIEAILPDMTREGSFYKALLKELDGDEIRAHSHLRKLREVLEEALEIARRAEESAA